MNNLQSIKHNLELKNENNREKKSIIKSSISKKTNLFDKLGIDKINWRSLIWGVRGLNPLFPSNL